MKKVLLDRSSFSGADSVWQQYGPRDEIRPECSVDGQVSRAGSDGSLRIDCTSSVQYGGWVATLDEITPGAWYRFDACYRAQQVSNEQRKVVARLDWRTKSGERAGQPDYAYRIEDAGGGWKQIWAVVPAPSEAAKVRIELLFGWNSGGSVWWDDVALAQADPPKPRPVKIATVFHRPNGNTSAQANVEEFGRWIDRAAREKPDVICLPEGTTMVGTGLTYAQAAEPIPGPTSERLGEMAREHNCYIEACYNERDGRGVYNTAILLDRKGELVGKYRKAYLPREEVDGGVTPGDDCPVFDTDFGKVGMMICWDVQYVEPAQLMALKGAEIILLPIWGGNETLMKARAIENQVFLVSCGYDVPSWIIDPEGKVLAEASKDSEDGSSVAIAEVDLSKRYEEPWLGDMRARFAKEHRDDLR
jgi:predicted amidohydrolase